MIVQLGKEPIRVGDQGGKTCDDERTHFAIPEGGLRGCFQVGWRPDGHGGITVLTTHGKIMT
ncbi:hypothetical protein ACFYWU_40450 [Streptomyces chrestomyceticus]|uniref:hypothetical protein n=1 Tax=Streptomyces chrestomyceticus TaxID=68185 RepID=UPI0036898443